MNFIKTSSKATPNRVIKSSNSDLEVVEALLARKYSKCREKYKGNIPLIYIFCEEVGHIAERRLNKEKKDEKKSNKHKGKKDFKDLQELQGKR